jgi:hypothetical protein
VAYLGPYRRCIPALNATSSLDAIREADSIDDRVFARHARHQEGVGELREVTECAPKSSYLPIGQLPRLGAESRQAKIAKPFKRTQTLVQDAGHRLQPGLQDLMAFKVLTAPEGLFRLSLRTPLLLRAPLPVPLLKESE